MLKALLERWRGEDITKIIKKDLLLVQDVVDLDKMGSDERSSYLLKAHELWENPVFQDLVKQVASKQKDLTMEQAQTKEQLWAGRCNIATTSLFRDEAQRLDALYQGQKDQQEFNSYEII